MHQVETRISSSWSGTSWCWRSANSMAPQIITNSIRDNTLVSSSNSLVFHFIITYKGEWKEISQVLIMTLKIDEKKMLFLLFIYGSSWVLTLCCCWELSGIDQRKGECANNYSQQGEHEHKVSLVWSHASFYSLTLNYCSSLYLCVSIWMASRRQFIEKNGEDEKALNNVDSNLVGVPPSHIRWVDE